MKKQPTQLAYLLPNFFTASSIFAGIYSMISAIEGNFALAAWMVLLSLIFDGLDGRVARLTNTCSRFGVEFDSLADIVAFGAAPAILLYLYVGHDFGRFGIMASALFVIFGGIRLARFNVMTGENEPSVFIGVPIPTAAVFISILVLLFEKYSFLAEYKVVILLIALLVAVLMVSNIRYPSFKKVDMGKKHIRRVFVVIVAVAMIFFIYPVEGFATFFTLYILYGPLRSVVTLSKRSRLLK
ncbi:CDP-diacylglycerol--serine O-phosphatidyltransferase [Sulfurimonas sp. HSL3-7]|uniref:CDP-diacylglycerol--serine O-phosphatidyltransferase n=1 Tax=Sulfonitrofixus jiaomeiensis TaxID=3131938 RepID=UPI0031F8D3BD